VAALAQGGNHVVVVHGTSAAADTLAQRMGVPARTLQSPSGYVSRYTDPETLEVYTMAAAGQVNKHLVTKLQSLRVNAIGLSGVDGRLMGARRKDAVRAIDPETGRQRVVRDDYTGRIEEINGSLLHLLLDAGYTPVIAPLALGTESERLNVDGDRAAAMVAGAINADTLIILSNVPGLLAYWRTSPMNLA
jgi:acetylglutamate/LysW-gamma-L-alpha-aminoadipate kinase